MHPRTPVLIVLIATLAPGLLSTSLEAVTYYVRTSGNDSNSGTSAGSAWRTIEKAANTAVAGDTVYVGAGTYNEEVTPSNDGTSVSPIRFIADTTGAYTGSAGTVTIQAPSDDYALDVNSDNYQEWAGFRLRGSNQQAVRWNSSSGGALTNCTIDADDENGINCIASTLTMTGCTIEDCGDDGIEVNTGSNLTMVSCIIEDVDGDAVDVENNSTVVLIRACTFQRCGEDGISVEASNPTITVRETIIRDCAGDGIALNEQCTMTVLNCLLHSNDQEGLEIEDRSGTSVTVWHATIVGNSGTGVYLKGGAINLRNSIVANNSAYGLRRSSGTFTHTYNCVYSNTSGNFNGASSSTGEITSNPLFVSSSDFHLQSGSPAENTGIDSSSATTIDLDLVARPGGAGYDMGCYELEGDPLFVDVSSSTGFNVQTSSNPDYGSGLHWADLDNDGDLDVIITGDTSRVLLQSGGTFFASSFGGGNVRRQGALADFDNDGDLDFWAVSVAGDDTEALFTNNGSGTFSNAGALGFSSPTGNEGCAVADINGDGRCDVIMCSSNGNYLGLAASSGSVAFTASTATAWGLNDSGDYGNGEYCATADVDGDLRPDVFYHYGSGKLFLSEGDGTYRETPLSISVVTGSSDRSGSAWGDYDNDGDPDLFVARRASGSAGYLWRNDGTSFTNVAATAGITNTSGQRSACWGDYDNDGDLDLYVVTITGGNVLYQNLGSGTFSAVSVGAAASGDNHDACFIDYDLDGDLDLAVTREDATNVLLRNDTDTDEYLYVRVVGAGDDATNTAGIGVRVEVYDAAGTTRLARRSVGGARGYGGGTPLWLHFGGLDPSATYQVRVYFNSGVQTMSVVPSAASTTIGAITIAQMLTVTEPPPAGRQLVEWNEVDPVDH